MYIWVLRKRKWNGEWKPQSASTNRDLLLAEVKGLDPSEWDITYIPVLRE